MKTADLIRANLASVRQDLAETFPHLTDDMLAWAPAEGMRTFHGQFVEILATEQSMLDRIQGLPRKPFEEYDAPFWAVTSVQGLVAETEAVRSKTLALLDGLSETALNAPVDISAGFAAYLDLNPIPASELFRFIARHESYHAGQIVSYLWARGDDPYKWD